MENPHKIRKTNSIRESGEKRPHLSLAIWIKFNGKKAGRSKG
jgi:hypothetical protein